MVKPSDKFFTVTRMFLLTLLAIWAYRLFAENVGITFFGLPFMNGVILITVVVGYTRLRENIAKPKPVPLTLFKLITENYLVSILTILSSLIIAYINHTHENGSIYPLSKLYILICLAVFIYLNWNKEILFPTLSKSRSLELVVVILVQFIIPATFFAYFVFSEQYSFDLKPFKIVATLVFIFLGVSALKYHVEKPVEKPMLKETIKE